MERKVIAVHNIAFYLGAPEKNRKGTAASQQFPSG